jgi:hypothetical protein
MVATADHRKITQVAMSTAITPKDKPTAQRDRSQRSGDLRRRTFQSVAGLGVALVSWIAAVLVRLYRLFTVQIPANRFGIYSRLSTQRTLSLRAQG